MLVPGMTLAAVVIVLHLALIVFGSPLMPAMGQGKCTKPRIMNLFEYSSYTGNVSKTKSNYSVSLI
jgi:hypothetical protein